MRAALVFVAAAGLALMVTGLPVLRPVSLKRRVLPYVGKAGGPRTAATSPLLLRLALRLGDARPLPKEQLELVGRVSEERFRAEQVLWAATAAAVVGGAAVVGASFGSTPLPAIPLASGVAALCGWLARDWQLGKESARVRREFRDQLPTAIDLVTLSVMAGETVPVAFERTSHLLGGFVGRRFGSVGEEVRDGTPVVEALEKMGDQLRERSVQRFVDALCDAIERGTPLAEVLLAQAEDGREARRRELLEIGGRREVLMLVPVVFLIMPVVIVFALYPGLVALDLFVAR